jgi:hypothetical protein
MKMEINWIENNGTNLDEIINQNIEDTIYDYPAGLLLKNKDGQIALAGTFNRQGGVCDCCLNRDVFDTDYYTHFSISLIEKIKQMQLLFE